MNDECGMMNWGRRHGAPVKPLSTTGSPLGCFTGQAWSMEHGAERIGQGAWGMGKKAGI